MDEKEFDLEEVQGLMKRGKRVYVKARLDHLPYFEDDAVEGKGRGIKEGEVGLVVLAENEDAPEYVSNWGFRVGVDWGDFKFSYLEHWLINGFYFLGLGKDILPPVDFYSDFFYVSRVE